MLQPKKTHNQAVKDNPFSKVPTDIDNARCAEQIAVMNQINEAGEDPFDLTLLKARGQEIIKEGQYWYITPNRWPYQATKHHYLIVSIPYWTDPHEISAAAAAEFFEFFNWLVDYCQAPGGGVGFRFGDSNYSAGTVAHLHAQFIVPDLTHPEYKPVRFKIGKDKERLAAS